MEREDFILGLIIGVIIAIPVALILSTPINQAPTVKYFANKTYYENDEEWEIIKDPDTGRTKGVRVKRKAKEA